MHFARRSNRLTGIQRVEFNLINLLSAKYGGDRVRCVFFHPDRQSYAEFDPSERKPDSEFDAERLLIDLGLATHSSRYPSKVRIKSYLRAHARNKWQRVWLKISIYVMAWLSPAHLAARGLAPSLHDGDGVPIRLRPVARLSVNSHLVHLGSSWFFPQMWQFATRHKAQGGDVVQYVHDLIPVTHPHFMPAKEPRLFVRWLDQALGYATRFPCNSQWTAADLQRFAEQRGATCSRYVAPLAHEFMGFERDSQPTMPEQLASLNSRRFVLCVGTIEARKNGISLLKVWQQLSLELQVATPLLVFAGRYGKIGGDEFRNYLTTHPELMECVRVVDAPSDQTMAWLYRNCLFSTYPSHVEGWGLPVGESAWFGRYCVASRASSIPEVCGELVGYVDPDNLNSVAAGIRLALLEQGFLKQREAAIAASPLRTWQNVADDLYEYITAKT